MSKTKPDGSHICTNCGGKCPHFVLPGLGEAGFFICQEKGKKAMEIVFFSNGNTGVSKDGEQAPTLQRSWLLMFAKFLEERGVNPTKVKYILPNGDSAKIFKFKTKGDQIQYGWQVKVKGES